MPSCDFCDEEFESEEEMHVHWGEEHEDELNSHQKDKVKKAKRKMEEKQEAGKARRKKLLGWGFAGVLAVAFVAFVASQLGGGQGTQDFDLEGQPVLGDENASVTVVAFEDYRCPYCSQFENGVFPRLKENYIDTGKVKFSFVNFAFLGPGSTQAAIAGECVYDQDKQQFWDFHEHVFSNQGPEGERWVNTDLLVRFANESTEGLDYGELRQCIQQGETLGEVRSDKSLGQSHGVSSTPSIYVNGDRVQNWDYRGLSSKIEKELN